MIVMRTLMFIGLAVAGLIVAYGIYMIVVAVVPGFFVPEQPLPRRRPSGPASQRRTRKTSGSRKDVSFQVKGTPVSGWLYLPGNLAAPVPCIVMAHGLGATKDMGLDAYAVRFQEAGFAVLAFDFRHLGESGGEPRQLVWIPYQQEDYAAAIRYVRGVAEIDPARIALWGTSLSGGHVLVAASWDGEIACVSAQVPLLDGWAGGREMLKRLGLGRILWMSFGHALRDLVRSWLGLSPHRIPLVGRPGTVAVMADAGAWNAFEALAPDGFVNQVCARILIRMDKYKPLSHLDKVHCPFLLQVCDRDVASPPHLVLDAARRLGEHGQVVRYPIDHFDIYRGTHFERAVSDQVAFFKKHLAATA
jgi:fermentation-respiration switch protein FrsA (DUF1100 family)